MILEHINLRVPSIALTRDFLQAAFPDFRERGSGYSEVFGYWSHIGNDDHYIALLQRDKPGEEPNQPVPPYNYSDTFRVMHIAYAIDSVDTLMQRLRKQGIEPSDVESLNVHPWRRRVYYLDGNGVEWEFIEYLSDDPAQRNDYAL